MNMIEDILTVVLLAAGLINFVLEAKRDLMMLQQNSYRNERYMRWLRASGDTTSVVRLLCYAALLIMLMPHIPVVFRCVVALIPLLINIFKLLVAKYKKPLVWTKRARRIYGTACALCVIVIGASWLVCHELFSVGCAVVAVYALSHVLML